jgi:hypothetical protein
MLQNISADCYEDSIDYPGNELALVPQISSAYFCLQECKKNPACLFYSFNIATKGCSLKNSLGDKVASNYVVSGSVVCEPRGTI